MKKTVLSLVFCIACTLNYAQTARQSSPPNSGNFFVTVNKGHGPEGVLVGYTLSPETFTNNLNLSLAIWEPMMMSVKIFTINSELVANWMPEQTKKQYTHNFDISNFPTGNYKMEIYGPDSKVVKTINFQKQAETSQIHSGN